MARQLVTGVAGFIGSHLAARLLAEGHEVRGIDCFDPYYDRAIKERNLQTLQGEPGFEFQELDLSRDAIAPLLAGVECIYHQAARAGVRASWGSDFAAYVQANVIATQRLLETLREQPDIRLVFASSSSVYGEGPGGATSEEAPRRPISPYGVTKLASESLVSAYHTNFGIPTVALRYFTVYGPRQRPDMAFHRFVRAALAGREIEVYGDGRHERDFTNVADAVEANLAAARHGRAGAIYNIGGGSPASVLEVIGMLESILGEQVAVVHRERRAGDPRVTAANTTRAREELGFTPRVDLRSGLQEMVTWMRAQRDGGEAS